MITITINGKKLDRGFPFMPQALAWVYQSGECHAAQKIEIACSDAAKGAKPIEPPKIPEPVKESPKEVVKPASVETEVPITVPQGGTVEKV